MPKLNGSIASIFLSPLLAATVPGCATVGWSACAPGEQSTVSDVLYFGMAKPTGGVVSEAEWADFLRTAVTPRFPAGLTVWPAAGQWRGANGQVVREDSRVLHGGVQIAPLAGSGAAREIRRLHAACG